MPVAEIIAIGTELLLGEIQDTNTRHLARQLREAGIDIFRTTMIGDNAERIAQAIKESLDRAQIVITTGGLGPTVDDPTRDAVSLAAGVETEYRPELWEQILARFQRYGRQATENNRRQAYIPHGATAIENPVGTAPAFRVEMEDRVIISLPGVPREMEYLLDNDVLPYLKHKYQLEGTIQARVIHTAGVGESQVDEWLGDLEYLTNPTVGLAAHAGQIDVRVTAKAVSLEEASTMLDDLSGVVMQRLGHHVYGVDDDTLESVVAGLLARLGWSLSLLDCGMGGIMAQRLGAYPALRSARVEETVSPTDYEKTLLDFFNDVDTQTALAANFIIENNTISVDYTVWILGQAYQHHRTYGGPPLMAPLWAANTGLDYLRRRLLDYSSQGQDN